jgi:hypothetical protein
MWFGLILAQGLIFCVMYQYVNCSLCLKHTEILFFFRRISLIQARNYFLNAYYDPFNPELFKSGNIIHLPRLYSSSAWPQGLLRDGDAGSTWFESVDIAAYFLSMLWPQTDPWIPLTPT